VERDRHDHITLRRMRQPIVCHQLSERLGQSHGAIVLESMYGFADCAFEIEDGADAWNLKWHSATSKAEPRGGSIELASTPDTEGELNAGGLADTLLAEPRAQFVAADATWGVEEVKNGCPDMADYLEGQESLARRQVDPTVSPRPYHQCRCPSS
jgi:hypothetical protein